MKFSVSRDELLRPLTLVAGVVERRQTLPILSNVLMILSNNLLSLTGTDLEVEIVGRLPVDADASDKGEITVPARKLLDICKSLPEGCRIEFGEQEGGKVLVKSGRSRFILSSLPASDFPKVEDSIGTHKIVLPQLSLKKLIDRTAFAMAQQDVRYYLNGMLWEIHPDTFRVVATDGHRLAMCSLSGKFPVEELKQVILPRKGVIELSRLLYDDDGEVSVVLGDNHIRASTSDDFTFTSKVVDGKFPDYARVIPSSSDKMVIGAREDLQNAFTRAAILSNEKYRGVRLVVGESEIQIEAHNPEQEKAEETVEVDYSGNGLEIGFNVSYLLDVLSTLHCKQIRLSLSDASSSVLLEDADPDPGDEGALYVVMPMRL
jgi:DNA polymerase-3 subunit beta